MNLERQLIEAFRRKQPPPGMVERVMAKISATERPGAGRPFWHAHWSRLRLAACVVLAVSIGFGVVRQQEARRERDRAELVAQQLITALQIASETLKDAQRIVQQQNQ